MSVVALDPRLRKTDRTAQGHSGSCQHGHVLPVLLQAVLTHQQRQKAGRVEMLGCRRCKGPPRAPPAEMQRPGVDEARKLALTGKFAFAPNNHKLIFLIRNALPSPASP